VTAYNIELINGAIGRERLTNESLAERSGLSVNTISAIRNGKGNPGIKQLQSVAEALKIPMAELFTPAEVELATAA
jgi:transcriptional regulator with XRE-family HTH domain